MNSEKEKMNREDIGVMCADVQKRDVLVGNMLICAFAVAESRMTDNKGQYYEAMPALKSFVDAMWAIFEEYARQPCKPSN